MESLYIKFYCYKQFVFMYLIIFNPWKFIETNGYIMSIMILVFIS